MGKSSPSQPAAPDPAATAAAQATVNRETAITQGQLNQINQYTPYGNLEYTQRGTTEQGTPQYSATQTLAPDQQRMLDLTNQAGIQYGETANTQLGQVSDRLSSPLDFGGLGPAPQANEQTRQNVYDSIVQRNQPMATQQYDQLQTRLANQGLSDPNSQAYRSAVDEYYRGQNDFGLAAQNAALGQQSQLFGMESAARNQGINEILQQRSVPLNELSAMLTGSQVQQPQFINVPQAQIAPADIMGATYGSYNAQVNAANAQQQAATANRQGLYGLAGTGALAAAMYF
jgi:hypothetical protein